MAEPPTHGYLLYREYPASEILGLFSTLEGAFKRADSYDAGLSWEEIPWKQWRARRLWRIAVLEIEQEALSDE